MTNARRKDLQWDAPAPDTHAGLLRDRGLRHHKEMDGGWDKKGATPEEQLLNSVVDRSASSIYKAAFARWQAVAEQKYLVLPAATAGPLAVGLGGESPLEAGLTIHHTYGMPVIPGSAVKGLCRRAALKAGLQPKSAQFQVLFGVTPEQGKEAEESAAGCCVFWDAWYDPLSVAGKPFHRDVVTVHHPEYYGQRGKTVWPTDFDDPRPVPFLIVKPKARFLFAVQTPGAEWDDYVRAMLQYSLSAMGIGAKTNAGYGRFLLRTSGGDTVPATAASVVSEAVTEVWESAHVKYDKGRKEFVATKGTERALAKGKNAEALMAKLAPEVLERLKKKPQSMRVTVKRLGNQLDMVALTPIEGA